MSKPRLGRLRSAQSQGQRGMESGQSSPGARQTTDLSPRQQRRALRPLSPATRLAGGGI